MVRDSHVNRLHHYLQGLRQSHVVGIWGRKEGPCSRYHICLVQTPFFNLFYPIYSCCEFLRLEAQSCFLPWRTSFDNIVTFSPK